MATKQKTPKLQAWLTGVVVYGLLILLISIPLSLIISQFGDWYRDLPTNVTLIGSAVLGAFIQFLKPLDVDDLG